MPRSHSTPNLSPTKGAGASTPNLAAGFRRLFGPAKDDGEDASSPQLTGPYLFRVPSLEMSQRADWRKSAGIRSLFKTPSKLVATPVKPKLDFAGGVFGPSFTPSAVAEPGAAGDEDVSATALTQPSQSHRPTSPTPFIGVVESSDGCEEEKKTPDVPSALGLAPPERDVVAMAHVDEEPGISVVPQMQSSPSIIEPVETIDQGTLSTVIQAEPRDRKDDAEPDLLGGTEESTALAIEVDAEPLVRAEPARRSRAPAARQSVPKSAPAPSRMPRRAAAAAASKLVKPIAPGATKDAEEEETMEVPEVVIPVKKGRAAKETMEEEAAPVKKGRKPKIVEGESALSPIPLHR